MAPLILRKLHSRINYDDCIPLPDLPPDGGHPGLIAQQGVHGDAVLDDQGRDGDQWKDQHVEDEKFLSARS